MNVSVVIPTYNGKSLLEKHLQDVFLALDKGDEVVVVDDASTDDTISFLKKEYPQVVIVTHHKNMRFAQSCNDGVKKAKHDICILLNNDVSPKKDFKDVLIKHLEDKNVFAVGCLEENNEGVISGRALGKFSRGMLIHRRALDQSKSSTLWASGGSMAFAKSIWESIGGMDTLYAPAYWEDIDLSYRALKLGYDVLFESKSRVFHQHETTNSSALGKTNLLVASYRNMFLFYWKNITSDSLLFLHFLWLPYHLTIGAVKTNGLLLKGFIEALSYITVVDSKRKQLKKLWKLSDQEVMRKVGNK